METRPIGTGDAPPPAEAAQAPPARPPATEADGAAEAPRGQGPERRIAELEARLDALLAENRALSLERKWAAACAGAGLDSPRLVEKWRPGDEGGIDAALDDLRAFIAEFRGRAAHRPAAGAPPDGQKPPRAELSARGRAALDGFRRDSERNAKKT